MERKLHLVGRQVAGWRGGKDGDSGCMVAQIDASFWLQVKCFH